MTHYQVEHRNSQDGRWKVVQYWQMEQSNFRRFLEFLSFYNGVQTAEAFSCYRIRRTVVTKAEYEFDGHDLVKL